MKNWILFSLALLISFALAACDSSARESTTTLQSEQNGVTLKITLKAEGDKVIEQTADNTVTYEALGGTTPEEAEDILSEFVVGYDETEGITHQIDYGNDLANETLTIDYETADLTKVNQLSGTSYEGDPNEDVSLKGTVDMMQEQGFEIVE
jgi:uncharacterized lipoprotein YehR (DUF1307 family)